MFNYYNKKLFIRIYILLEELVIFSDFDQFDHEFFFSLIENRSEKNIDNIY